MPLKRPVGKSHCSGERVRIPTKSAADSERMRPPLGAERRKLSNVTQSWPTSGFFASRLRIDSPFKVIL
ncbi:MAG: hypothetical protein EWM73_00185 [Nitrospira sp.]|nr:MAG: hypothetical protein EWM73_00185 [Nitrospira sp.]